MDKRAALEALEVEMAANAALPLAGQANLVFGEGNPDCAVLFIGEAPGYHEDVERRPFVGRAGQLLRRLIREAGWKEADVYITNIVKRRPPENRDPLPEEIRAYEPYLARQIDIIDPKVVVALGRFSTNFFLPDAKITRDQGKAFRAHLRGGAGDGGPARLIIPLFHPAAALRAPAVLDALERAFRTLPEVVEKGDALSADLPPAREEKRPDAQRGLFS